jgi:hypothetical protein
MRSCSRKVKSKQRYESNEERKQKAAPSIVGAALFFTCGEGLTSRPCLRR